MSLEQKVEQLMTRDIETIESDKTAKEVAAILARKRNGCVVVVRSGVVIGIVTEQDVVAKITANGVDPSKVLVRDIMSTPVISVKNTATLKEVAAKLSEYEIRRLIVVGDNNSLSGLITAEDLARWLARLKNYDDVTLNAIARVKQEPPGGPYQ